MIIDGLRLSKHCTTLIECCNKNVTKVTIPESVEIIEDNAFNGCKYLKKVSIPCSVIYIGDNAFYGCANLRFVSMPNNVYIGKNTFFGSALNN